MKEKINIPTGITGVINDFYPSDDQLYKYLFQTLDVRNEGILQGSQIFGLFMSSGINKSMLGDIWDEATAKHSGGLDVSKFTNALKLISLAQNEKIPKLENIPQDTSLPIAKLNYPDIRIGKSSA